MQSHAVAKVGYEQQRECIGRVKEGNRPGPEEHVIRYDVPDGVLGI